MSGNIFTIPAGVPFADALAKELLRRAGHAPEGLARMRVLLPTRRAARTLRQSFLQLNGGRPLLLPRLQPLGDVDAEELAFESFTDDEGDIPPAIAPLKRQMVLARLILARGDVAGPAQALALATELARLLDRVATEGLDLANLAGLAGDYAAHWQKTLAFLEIVRERWPEYLAANGVIDPADRRNRLLLAQAAAWAARPPDRPVIAAGITGSIPAAASLLRVVANLPHVAIVLPGLNLSMDAESWDAVDASHPQASLKQLLGRLGVTRDEVRMLGAGRGETNRAWLATELMRPAATTPAWADLRDKKPRVESALSGLARLDADTPQEEALAIALMLRETLETPGRTAALVTPDRDLARRVAACCRRWGLSIDDSAGLPLGATETGRFLRLIMQAVAARLAPAALLALLRHDFCRLGLPAPARRAALDALETGALRGPRPAPGIAGLRRRAGPEHEEFLRRIEMALSPLLDLGTKAAFGPWLDALLRSAEALATMPDEAGDHLLWSGEAGEAAATLFAELQGQADFTALSARDFAAALDQLMRPVTVRPVWGTHARLSILGQLEARLLQADLVILGGLNEGIWPPDPGHDPWLSRPMMAEFGLPPPEQAVGFAAHDFVQGFCAPNIVLTRARRVAGAPTVPARWLQRLDAVLESAGLDPDSVQEAGRFWLALAREADRSAMPKPARRPEPRPPLSARPRELSVTDIDIWLRDPYQIYARRILRLPVLKVLEEPPDAAARGTLLHDIMRVTVRVAPEDLPRAMLERGRFYIAQRADDPGFWDFWWPRLERIAGWTAAQEAEWRLQAVNAGVEVKGRMTLPAAGGAFTLKARADRIDRRANGSYALIDYKSGGQYSREAIRTGAAPQLGLEAFILSQGQFETLPAADVSWLGYWILKGDRDGGKIVAHDQDIGATMEAVHGGLQSLIDSFDDPATPYLSVPDPDRAPRYNDYAQLARLQEWTALGEAEALP